MLYGIDVSSNQPKNVCAKAVNDFAIVKMSGNPQSYSWNYVNPYASQQVADAYKKHGRVGLYHFTWGKKAETEAEFFVSQVKKLGYLKKAVLVIDYEAEALELGRGWVGKFAKRVEELAGYKPVIYASGSVIVSQGLFSLGYPIWCASYQKSYQEVPGRSTKGMQIYPGCEKSVLWQFTSQGLVSGYDDVLDCNVFYGNDADWKKLAGMTGKEEPKKEEPVGIDRGQLAADIHKRMVNDNRFGYSWEERWGAKPESWTVDGVTFPMNVGDYDCSSSCITAWKKALTGTKYANALEGATFTGNMRSVFVNSGLFEWKPISFIAHPGDLYLNEANHVAMCQQQVPDELSEFSWGDKGAYGNKRGDQSGTEAAVNPYYEYPWDGILHYNGKANDGEGKPDPKPSPTPKPAKLKVDGEWGALTTKEFKRQLGIKVNGKKDAALYRALRKKIGPAPKTEANWDKFTKPLKKSLQKKLGVKEDGVIGPVTVKALQKALNAGKVAKW